MQPAPPPPGVPLSESLQVHPVSGRALPPRAGPLPGRERVCGRRPRGRRGGAGATPAPPEPRRGVRLAPAPGRRRGRPPACGPGDAQRDPAARPAAQPPLFLGRAGVGPPGHRRGRTTWPAPVGRPPRRPPRSAPGQGAGIGVSRRRNCTNHDRPVFRPVPSRPVFQGEAHCCKQNASLSPSEKNSPSARAVAGSTRTRRV